MPEANEQSLATEPKVVPQEQHDALVARFASLEASHKATQRALHNAQLRGSDTKNLERKLEANEALTLKVVELLGKMGGETIDVKPILEAHERAQAEATIVDQSQAAAGTAIVAAFSAAGFDEALFEETWRTDPRFKEAKALWDSGKYDASVKEAVRAATTPMTKTITEDDVKTAVAEALATERQTKAAGLDSGKQTSAGSKKFDLAAWRKLPAEERVKTLKEMKEALYAS